ncbi:hypothetical protein N7468_004547 [Penicillium chermesinum]|uniref:Uncharacterized protein n=1 Tax=Penicillium chermesinum TaxID=63820 RepID=A0A9W9P8N3_9EURO|nr:uncharacterized protein N7468_004547 [Penicillium chermesinum]KAJ5239928.1 hypothetical protein N7468_004547 [Penicillium chermesinum]
MALRTSAEEAEDAAAGFSAFRAPLPEHSTEITSYIADLYSISASLTSLDDLSKDARIARNWSRIQADLELVQKSLKYTISDIFDHFGRLDGGKVSPDIYKRTWGSMNRFFWDESQYSLTTRFAKYKALLRELNDMLKDSSSDTAVLLGYRHGIKTLLVIQEDRAERSERRRLRRQPSTDVIVEAPRPPHRDSPTSTVQHWIKEVFSSYETETAIPEADHKAGCYDDYQVDKRTLKEDGFEQVLQLAFNDRSQITVYYFIRQSDHRTRIVCKVPHRSRPSESFCFPLNLLEIARSGSSLHLCRRRNGGSELVIWATLNFMTIESLVAFYCTFLALRAQDTARDVKDIRDYEMEEEEELFGGQIDDDGYLHALRVYQDIPSKSIRLQASIHNGPKQRTPVWTAFITHHLHRRGWLKLVDSRTVVVRRMEPFVFMSEDRYRPPKTSRGEHILKFRYASDAEGFLDTIEDIADALP